MTGIRLADYILAAAGLLGHALVLLLLIRRHRSRQFATFTILMAFYLLRSASFLLPGSLIARGEIYWLFIFLDPALQTLLMLSFGLAAQRRRHSVALAALGFLVVAGFLAWLIGPSSYYSPQNLAIRLSIFVSALWLQTALALCALGKRHPQTTRLSLGIAIGFAAYSVVNIVTEAVRMHYALLGPHSLYAVLSYLRVAVYLGCLAAWSLLLWATPHAFRQGARQREQPRG